MIAMKFYAVRTPDGFIHVQNCVGIFFGQHHVHNETSFTRWKNQDKKPLDCEVKEGLCDCGLNKSGMVKSRDGDVYFNDIYEKP